MTTDIVWEPDYFLMKLIRVLLQKTVLNFQGHEREKYFLMI